MLNEVMRVLNMPSASEWCANLSGSYLNIWYLYRWYNHSISMSSGWMGASSPCCVFIVTCYSCHSHSSLVCITKIKSWPFSTYLCAMSCWVLSMSFSILHLFVRCRPWKGLGVYVWILCHIILQGEVCLDYIVVVCELFSSIILY